MDDVIWLADLIEQFVLISEVQFMRQRVMAGGCFVKVWCSHSGEESIPESTTEVTSRNVVSLCE
jgi:hypothetical protein